MGRMKDCNNDLIIGSREWSGLLWSLLSDRSTSSPAAATGCNISVMIIPEHVQLFPLICFVLIQSLIPCSEESEDGVLETELILETMRRCKTSCALSESTLLDIGQSELLDLSTTWTTALVPTDMPACSALSVLRKGRRMEACCRFWPLQGIFCDSGGGIVPKWRYGCYQPRSHH